MAEQAPSCWPVILWWLVVWCVRVIWVDGAGTASQLCSLQSGPIGSPEEPGERIGGEFRCSVAPIHDQALSHSPLVFGHLQDIDRRTLYSESKDPGPTPGSISPPLPPPQVYQGIIYLQSPFLVHASLRFGKCILMHHHHNQDREQSHHPRVPLCFSYSTFLPQLPASDPPPIFSVSIILPFSECHISGITQDMVFWVWFLPL